MKWLLTAIFLFAFRLCYGQIPVSAKVDEGRARFYALLFAEEQYKNGFPVLSRPIADANSLRNALVSKYGFDPEKTIVEANKSRYDVVDLISNMADEMEDNDNLLIFFAGHGTYKPGLSDEGNEGFLIPIDGEQRKYHTFISANDLAIPLKSCKAKHILLITDACFSGSLVSMGTRGAGTASTGNSFSSLETRQLYAKKSRQIMASGNLDPVPDKSEFIKYLIQALDQNNDNLPSDRLLENIRPQTINNTGGLTTPICARLLYMGDEEGQFIFYRNGKVPGSGPSDAQNLVTVRFITGADCQLYIDGKFAGPIAGDGFFETQVRTGSHQIRAVSTKYPAIALSQEFNESKKGGEDFRLIPIVEKIDSLLYAVSASKPSNENITRGRDPSPAVSEAVTDDDIPEPGDFRKSDVVNTLDYTPLLDKPAVENRNVLYEISDTDPVHIIGKVKAANYYHVSVGQYTGYILAAFIKTPRQTTSVDSSKRTEAPGQQTQSFGDPDDRYEKIHYHDDISIFTNVPLYDIPDQTSGKLLMRLNTDHVKILERVNSRYYYISAGGDKGYLFVGWIKGQL